ncbi:hypothetical protein ZYGR_0P03340 [Zygosaccharomyces rouxii]|uniref:Major facilitator superfamily (MFS) profile domain-containing protein n=1 Tax=Zygosaccharomyces rouxii TaxID=4956 RepID=A0A1Q3A1X1_ZYGRO|nr:hypothetical protein ZYGR_0P03340 [Zygosaccharomyces rouxii]
MNTPTTSLMKEIFVDPWRRLKFGIIPVKRVLEEDNLVKTGSTEPESLSDEWDDKKRSLREVLEETPDSEVDEEEELNEYEYRDQANRPWWKFFDEQEYRITKKKGKSNHWYSWFNGSPSTQEKKLILKLDILLALYACMSYWVKYLDSVNLNNAYVSGMKESLGMHGNDLVHVQNMFSIGNIVSQVPFLFVLNKVPLNYLLPTLDLCWSLMTLGQGFAHTTDSIKALRFFVGFFEGPSYLAFQYLFGCFYKHDEVVRRSAFFYFGQYIGILSSGGIQSAVYKSLNGRNGLAGWRWNFIFDFIISIIVALIGFYSLPGDPQNCYSIFLTDDEIRLARTRLKENKTEGNDFHKKVFDIGVWKKIIFDWKIWIVSIWAIFCWDNSNVGSGCYILWLKSLTNSNGEQRYSIPKVNTLSMITPALGLVYLTVTALIADKLHSRWSAILFTQIFNIIGNVILAVWNVQEGAKWFAFMLQCMGWAMAPVFYGWVNDICRRDSESRGIIMTAMNIAASVFSVWTSVVFFPTTEAPRYLKGYSFAAANALALILWTFLVLWFYKNEERKYAKENGIILYNSNVGVPPKEERQQLGNIYHDDQERSSSPAEAEGEHVHIVGDKGDKIINI